MRRIAIAAAKGGTGKTTTAVTLAHGLALRGRTVLLVDCDPRRHVALHFGLPSEAGLAAWLGGHGARAVEVRAGLRVLDSGGLAWTECATRLDASASGRKRLRDALDTLADVDYVLLDCPTGGGAAERLALAACDEVLLPVGADYLSLASVRTWAQVLSAEDPPSGAPRLLGLLATFYDPSLRSTREVDAVLATAHPGRTLRTRIHTCDSIRSAPALRGSVFDADPLSQGARDYARLTDEIEGVAA